MKGSLQNGMIISLLQIAQENPYILLFVHGPGSMCALCLEFVYNDEQGHLSDQRKWAWTHDEISAKANIQARPRVIAQSALAHRGVNR